MLETRLRTFADNTGGGSSSSVVYAQTGDTFLVYSASTSLTNERIIVASDNITIVSSGTSFLISAVSSVAGASTGLSITLGNYSINTNIRDKTFGYFFAGSLSTVALASSAMIYIPFNMEIRDVRLAVSNSSSGQNILINPLMWNSTLQASSAVFASANRPAIITNSLVGSHNGTFSYTSLFAGSWLGINLDQIGTTVIGSNLTVTFIVRAS